MSNFELATKFLLQLAVILLLCRITAYVGKRYLGQTEVVCEMLAGILLGPSFLGIIYPNLQQWLFPTTMYTLANGQLINNPSMSILYALSQVGLCIYMFLVGLEFDIGLIKNQINKVMTMSSIGTLTPLVFGSVATLFLYRIPGLFNPDIEIWLAGIYLGVSLAITSLPMLARILYERGLVKTNFGSLILTASLVDDAIVWCILTFILAYAKNQMIIALFAIGGGLGYILFIFFGNKKLFNMILYQKTNAYGSVYLLTIILFCGWYANVTGIYTIFASFILGISIPKTKLIEQFKEQLKWITTSLLVPIFFVYSGLNTQITLLDNATLWLIAIFIFILAILSKGVTYIFIMKKTGESWRNATAFGTLMNTRGLTGLLVVNLGLDNNIITPKFFTILIIEVIATTLITSPLLALFYGYNNYDIKCESSL